MMKKENKRLILKKDDLAELYYNIKDLSFTKLRSFTDYNLAAGIQRIDFSRLSPKMKKIFKSFLEDYRTASRKERVNTRYLSGDYAEIRILHGFGYSWGQDVEGCFTEWIIKKYNIKRTSKTYKNLIYTCSLFNL